MPERCRSGRDRHVDQIQRLLAGREIRRRRSPMASWSAASACRRSCRDRAPPGRVDALMSRSTAASLVCADQWPSPKSRVRRSAAATRTAAIAAASSGVAGDDLARSGESEDPPQHFCISYSNTYECCFPSMMMSILPVRPASSPVRGVGDDGDVQARLAAVHDAGVLQREAALLAVQRAGDALDRRIRRRLLHREAGGGDHLALRGAVEIAVKLLVERHPPEVRSLGREVARLRRDLDVERAGGLSRYFAPACIRARCGPSAARDRSRRRAGCRSRNDRPDR